MLCIKIDENNWHPHSWQKIKHLKKESQQISEVIILYAKMHFDNIDFFDIFQLQFRAFEIVVECARPTTGCTQLANPPVPSPFYPLPRLCARSLAHARPPPARPCSRLPHGLATVGGGALLNDGLTHVSSPKLGCVARVIRVVVWVPPQLPLRWQPTGYAWTAFGCHGAHIHRRSHGNGLHQDQRAWEGKFLRKRVIGVGFFLSSCCLICSLGMPMSCLKIPILYRSGCMLPLLGFGLLNDLLWEIEIL
jgi:hypothetical protein